MPSYNLLFAALREQCTAPTLAAQSGGSLTGATKYFALVGANRCGVNKLSTIATGTWTTGQKLVLTIPGTIRTDAEDLQRVIVLASNTNDPDTMQPVAWWRGYNLVETSVGSGFYTESKKTLSPAPTITFEHDSQLQPGGTVANPTALTAVTNPLDGTVRYVVSLDEYFYYDPFDTQTPDAVSVIDGGSNPGNWLPWMFGALNLEDLTGPGGCWQDVRTITEEDILFPPPAYKMDGANSSPVRYWLANGVVETGNAIAEGSQIGLEVALNGVPRSIFFDRKLFMQVDGLARLSDGSLDTDGIGTGIERTYVYNQPLYQTEADLPPGYAYILNTYARFREESLDMQARAGAITFSPTILPLAGSPVPAFELFGNQIYNKDERSRVYPLNGAGYRVGTGSGVVEGYEFFQTVRRDYTLGATSAVNQKIGIDGHGAIFWVGSGDLDPTMALRALVSMQSGRSNACAWSSQVAITAGGAITVTVTYPTAIRGDYPDVIKSSSIGEVNAPNVVVYVQRMSDNQIFEFPNFLRVAGATQQFQVTNLTEGTAIGSVPSTTGNFGLFEAVSATLANAPGAGAIAAGNYRVAYAFRYTGLTITDISHDVNDGCVPEAGLSVAESLANNAYWRPPVNTFAGLPSSGVEDGEVRLVLTDRQIYQYQLSTSSWKPLPTNWGNSVATAGGLPVSGGANEIRYVADTDTFYRFNSGTSNWVPMPSSYWGAPVAAVANLPASAPAGQVRLVTNLDALYMFKSGAWVLHPSSYWGAAGANLAALPTTNVPDGQCRIALDSNTIYRFDLSVPEWVAVSGGSGGGGGGSGVDEVASVSALRALTPPSGRSLKILAENDLDQTVLVFYNPTSTRTDDGISIFKPSAVSSGDPGRWEAVMQPTYANIVTSGGDVVVDVDGDVVTTTTW